MVTLSKLELMLNVLTLGYIPIWMDTDMVRCPFMSLRP